VHSGLDHILHANGLPVLSVSVRKSCAPVYTSTMDARFGPHWMERALKMNGHELATSIGTSYATECRSMEHCPYAVPSRNRSKLAKTGHRRNMSHHQLDVEALVDGDAERVFLTSDTIRALLTKFSAAH